MALVKAIVARDITRVTQMLDNPHYDVNEIGHISEYTFFVSDYENFSVGYVGTPLMAAVSYNLYRVKQRDDRYHTWIELLLSHKKCNLNVFIDNQSRRPFVPGTALQCALASRNSTVKQLLLRHQRFGIGSSNGYSPRSNDLHFAAYYGDLDFTPMLMARTDINTKDNGSLPLHIAAMGGCVETAKLLMQHPQCDVNATDDMGRNALHVATSYGNANVIKLLANDPKCDINAMDIKGNRPIQSGLKRLQQLKISNNGTVEALIQHRNCDLNVKDNEGYCPLHLAAFTRHPELVTMLLTSARCDPGALTNEGESAITLHIKRFMRSTNHVRWINRCDEHFTDMLDVLTSTEVMDAAHHTLAAAVELLPVDTCEALIQKGANVNSAYPYGESSLHCSIRLNSFKKTQLLVKSGADQTVTWMDLTPLQYAITLGSNPKILLLLSKAVQMEEIESFLKRLSYECESPLSCSIRLGVHKWVEYFKQQNEEDTLEDWYTSLEPTSTKLKLDTSVNAANAIPAKEFHSWAFNCHRPLSHRTESSTIVATVIKVVETVASTIPRDSRFHFVPSLGGSIAEGTKVFLPDKVDLTCRFSNIEGLTVPHRTTLVHLSTITVDSDSKWKSERHDNFSEFLDPLKVTQGFLSCVSSDKCLSVITSLREKASLRGEEFPPLYLSAHSLDVRDKISRFQFLWRGDEFKELIVSVDLAPAFVFNGNVLIAKESRHLGGDIFGKPMFHISDAEMLRANIRHLPLEMRQGLLIAKAARLASICRPDDPQRLGICNDFDSQNLITSYMLKSCLLAKLNLKLNFPENIPAQTPYEWAKSIYVSLRQNGDVVSVVRQAVCEKILQYLQDNAAEFNTLSEELKELELLSMLSENERKKKHENYFNFVWNN